MTEFIIVDDTNPNIHYSSGWAFDNTTVFTDPAGPPIYGTLHVAVVPSDITFTFNGTLISAFGAQPTPGAAPLVWDCTVDGKQLNSFSWPSNFVNATQIPICSTSNLLDDGIHELHISVNGTADSPAFFDYIGYLASAGTPTGDTVFGFQSPGAQWSPGWNDDGYGFGPNLTFNLDFIGYSAAWYGFYRNILPYGPSSGTYIIDDETPVSFMVQNIATNHTTLFENQLFFQTARLPLGKHHLEVIFNADNQSTPLSFSYLIVQNSTTDYFVSPIPPVPAFVPPSTGLQAQSRSHLAAILGGSLGAVVSLLFLVVLVRVFMRRRRIARTRRRWSGVQDLKKGIDSIDAINHTELEVRVPRAQ